MLESLDVFLWFAGYRFTRASMVFVATISHFIATISHYLHNGELKVTEVTMEWLWISEL